MLASHLYAHAKRLTAKFSGSALGNTCMEVSEVLKFMGVSIKS